MRTMRIAGALIVGAGLLAAVGQAESEWQYTDAKGKTRTVMLKMDVPGEYRNTAVYVDLGSLNRAPAAGASVPVVAPAVVAPVGPVPPGTKWWTLPEGSPERAAAKLAAEQTAAELRNRATEAGVVDYGATGRPSSTNPFEAAANACRALVNDTGSRGQGVRGAESFQASVGGGLVHTYGTEAAKFAFAKCMTDRGQTVQETKDAR
jgi:hypothetical protein